MFTYCKQSSTGSLLGRAAPRPRPDGRARHPGRRARGARCASVSGRRHPWLVPKRVLAAAFAAWPALRPARPSSPRAHAGASFHQRAETKEDPDFRVTAAALSGEEARRFLGVDLERKGIRPIWVEIENLSGQGAWYFPIGTDPAYFAPYEVAYMFHRWWSGARNERIAAHLIEHGMPFEIPAHGTARGFVYSHDGQGTGYVRIEVVDDAKVSRVPLRLPCAGREVGLPEGRLRVPLSGLGGPGPRLPVPRRRAREAPLLRGRRAGEPGRGPAESGPRREAEGGRLSASCSGGGT